jgi:hypothetical protein
MSDLSLEATDFRRNSRALWWIVAVTAAATAIGLFATGLAVDFKSNPALLLLAAAYAAVAIFYRYIRFDERLSQALTAVAQLLLIVLLGLLLSYVAAIPAMPYRDADLLAIDQWLGFDRTSYVRCLTDSPWKIRLSSIIYLAMLPQLAAVPLLLILASRTMRLQQFALAYGIALISTIAIFAFVPAVGAFVYHDLTPAQYATLPPDIYTPARSLDALRAGAMKAIPLNNLEGLIAFPSFHTAAAILYAWALWPVRLVRWPIVALNTAILFTTPVDGAHYLIDVIAGAIVTLGSIALSAWICRSRTAPASLPAIQSA